MTDIPGVIFDTQILLRALINKRSASGRLVFHMQADYKLYTATQLQYEILDVLNRPKVRAKFPRITDEQVQFLVKIRDDYAHKVTVQPEEIESICRDPKDDIFLACAKAAKADYLVSEDKDLLVLKSHYTTQIVDVMAFLSVLDSRKNAEGERSDT